MPPSQSTSGLSADQMREAIASLSSTDRIDSPFGTLSFFDGVPSAETVDVIYDALDLIRGIDVFLNCLPGASVFALRRGLRSIGVETPAFIAYTDPSADSVGLALTANTETTYGTTFLDLKEWGPTVIESPPGSLCVVDDFWFRYVADMGIPGPDRARVASTCICHPATTAKCRRDISSSGRRPTQTGSCCAHSAACPTYRRPASIRSPTPAHRP
jgi:hypothetical protein